MAAQESLANREWTNLEGKKITADYLGIQGDHVALRMHDGKITLVPMTKLSAEDNQYLAAHHIIYQSKWSGWPTDAGMMMQYPDVSVEPSTPPGVVYVTPHFRFRCDVNLAPTLMKDLARIFELTLHLHERSPFGVLAKPLDDRYEAKLMGLLQTYRDAGGPPRTAGVYLPKKKVFLAPLELMGMKDSSSGWRKITDDYDPSTIIHELTHMLTHEMLDNLPTWANEGYAEYISSIPYQNKAFQTSPEKIREGVRDLFVKEYARTHSRSFGEIGKAERAKILTENPFYSVVSIAKVLNMTDCEWATGEPPKPGGKPWNQGQTTGGTDLGSSSRLPRLYRTAHLIFYYFIQIEGEKGINKIRAFLDENRAKMAKLNQYFKDYDRYEEDWKAFTKLPGVVDLGNGRIKYPHNLTPPKPPEAPLGDPNVLNLGGLPMLLEGDTVENYGKKIEAALIKDLGINLKFEGTK